jgi:hypothetical protein
MAAWKADALQNGSKGSVVLLTKLQSHVLRLLAAERSPDSYIAGAVVINREGPRFSGDIDIFQDTAGNIQCDAGALQETEWERQRAKTIRPAPLQIRSFCATLLDASCEPSSSMIPVVVLAVLFVAFSLVGRLGVPFMWGWWTSLRFALCGMFLLTASAHWGKRRPDLVRMVPSVFPKPALL